MKKFLIILISIFFTTNVHALVFEKCYTFSHSFGQKHKKFSEFPKDILEKNEFKIFSDGKIRKTVIFTDKELSRRQEIEKKANKDGKIIAPYQKIHTRIFNIKYADDKYIEAEKFEDIGLGATAIDKINLNLINGQVTSVYSQFFKSKKINNENKRVIQCKIKSIKKSYLDYWWAVILIIAITFFIFTQSGKRLKKIRRK